MGRTSVELQVYTNIPNFTSDHIYITRMSSAKEPGKEIPWRLYLLLYIRYITRVLLLELHEFLVYDFSVAISVSVSKECAANSSMGWVFKKNGNTYEKCELHTHVHVYKKHLIWTCKHYAIYIHKHVTHTFHFNVLLTVFCYSTLQIWTFNRCRCNSKPDMKKVNVNGILMHRCIIVGCTIFSLLHVFVNSVYISIYIPISLKNFKLQNFLRDTGGHLNI